MTATRLPVGLGGAGAVAVAVPSAVTLNGVDAAAIVPAVRFGRYDEVSCSKMSPSCPSSISVAERGGRAAVLEEPEAAYVSSR